MDKIKQLASKVGNKGEGGSDTTNNAATTDPAANTTTDPAAAGGTDATGKGDYLDQGVGFVGKETGRNLSREQEEAYSDDIRKGATKAGYNIPIQDQN